MVSASNNREAPFQITISHDFPVFMQPDHRWVHDLAGDNKFGVVVNHETGPLAETFEDTALYNSFRAVFQDGAEWSSTDFFKQNAKLIKDGGALWGCSTEDEFLRRLNRDVRALYYSIVEKGYLTQRAILNEYASRSEGILTRFKNYLTPTHQNNEIKIGFNEEGKAVFVDGRHRFAIAKILGLRDIPVNVVFRHQNWQDFHSQLKKIAIGLSNGLLYHRVSHPDLTYIPYAHGEERHEILEKALNKLRLPAGTKSLDIGANMGNLSFYLARKSHSCTAIENNFAYCNVIETVSRAVGADVKVFHTDLTDFDPTNFDVVFALNIFHHLTNEERTFEKLTSFIEKIDSKWMFFQPHNRYSGDSSFGKYRSFSPDSFAEFVAERAGFSTIENIGADPGDSRDIFLLGR